MNVIEQLKATGSLTIVKTNKEGVVTDKRHIPNLVVSSGKTHIISRMVGSTSMEGAMSHMGVGSGATSPSAEHLLLVTQIGNRVPLSSTTQTANVVTYVATFGTGISGGELREAGIFNATTAGTMLCRTTFPIVTKEPGDSIVITWVVTIS